MKTEKGVNSQLTIAHSDRHDSGVYRCIAENPYGRAEQIVFLAVQERPDTPSYLEVFEVGSRTIKLSWRRPFDGNSPVLSYLVQYQALNYLKTHLSHGSTVDDWNGNNNVINVTVPSTSISKRFVLIVCSYTHHCYFCIKYFIKKFFIFIIIINNTEPIFF